MKPIVMFPAVTVCGTKENAITIDDNRVTFRAMGNFYTNGSRPVYTFTAWDSIADRIKRMKVTAKSELVIYAEMNEYVKDNVRRQNYTILSVDFLRTNESLLKKSSLEKNDQDPVSEAPVVKNQNAEENKSASTLPPQNSQAQNVQSGFVSDELNLEEFQRLYCNTKS